MHENMLIISLGCYNDSSILVLLAPLHNPVHHGDNRLGKGNMCNPQMYTFIHSPSFRKQYFKPLAPLTTFLSSLVAPWSFLKIVS